MSVGSTFITEFQSCVMKSIGDADTALASFREKRPETLRDYPPYLDMLKRVISGREHVPMLTIEDVRANLQQYYMDEHLKEIEQIEAEEDELIQKISDISNQMANQKRTHNQSVMDANKVDNQSYESIKDSYEYILQNSQKITEFCDEYKIDTLNLPYSSEMVKDLNMGEILSELNKFMKAGEVKRNRVWNWILNANIYIKGGILLLILICLCTSLRNLLSLVFLGGLIYIQVTNEEDIKFFTVLATIAFKSSPEDFGYVALDSTQIIDEEVTDDELSTNEEAEALMKQLDELLQKADASQINNNVVKRMITFENERATVAKEIEDCNTKIRRFADAVFNDIEAEYETQLQEFNKLKEEFAGVAQTFSPHYAMRNRFEFGLHNQFDIEDIAVGAKSIIIRPTSDVNANDAFLRLMLANFYSGVYPEHCIVTVIDPDNIGRNLVAFYDEDTSAYFSITSDGSQGVISKFVDIAENNMKTLRGKTIEEYNNICEEKGLVPMNYHVVFLLSQTKVIEESETLKSFMAHSAEHGVILVVVSKTLMVENTYIFRAPYEGIPNPYMDCLSDDWVVKFLTNYKACKKKFSPPALTEQSFLDNVFPPEKIWAQSSQYYLYFYPGYKGGDPSKAEPITLGTKGDTHGMLVGSSGSGKSVFLHHLIITLAHACSPDEVAIWLADFKNVEFNLYFPQGESGATLPHVEACLCTTDPEFAASLFAEYSKICNDRQSMFSAVNAKDLASYNRYWDGVYEETKDPNVLKKKVKHTILIIDELTQIYNAADQDQKDTFDKAFAVITRLGRALGMQMFVASQDMKGTIKQDQLDQMTTTIACRLKNPSDSNTYIGCDKAAYMPAQYGYCVVKNLAMNTPDKMPYWRTPKMDCDIIPGAGPNEAQKIIQRLWDLGAERSIARNDMILYNEKDRYPIEVMEKYYDDNKEYLTDNGTFLIGNLMTYSRNSAPLNFIEGPTINSNIGFCFNRMDELCMFIQTLYINIKHMPGENIIIGNSQIDDIIRISAFDSVLDEDDKAICRSNTSVEEYLAYVEGMVDYIKNQPERTKTIWVFLLGWEKGIGWGIDPDSGLRTELLNLMKTAGTLDIHFIIGATTTTGHPNAIWEYCDNTICGKALEGDSISLLGSKKAYKAEDIENGPKWAYHKLETTVSRFKLWDVPLHGEVTRKSVFIPKGGGK